MSEIQPYLPAQQQVLAESQNPTGPRWTEEQLRIVGHVAGSPRLLNYISVTLRKRGVRDCDMDDLTQEACIRSARFTGDLDNIVPWLAVTCRNLVVDGWRRGQNPTRCAGPLEDLNDPPAPDSPEQTVLDNLALEATLKIIPEQYRELLLLSANGLNTKQIAERLGIPTGTVKSRLSTARGAARRALESSGITR